MPILEYRYDAAANLWRPWGKNRGGPIGGSTPNDRNSLVPGFFFPDASNVGAITPASKMATITGNQTWDAEHDGATITGTRFTGRVKLNTQNITFRDCRFEGYLPESTTPSCVWITGSRNANIKFIDCTFKPANVDHLTHIIMGHHFTATRCEFTGGVDGVDPVPEASLTARLDVKLEGCWIHDLAYFSPDSAHNSNPADNKTHNDCIQWQGGAGLTLVGNRIEGFVSPTLGQAMDASVDSGGTHISGNSLYPYLYHANCLAPIRASTSYPPLGELICQKNWFSGGAVALNIFAANPSFTTNDGSIIDGNRFGYDWMSGVNEAIYMKNAQVIPVTNNYRWGPSSWLHGTVTSMPSPRNEDVIDPWDTSVPFNNVHRFA